MDIRDAIHQRDLRAHRRALITIILLLLIVHALFALALMTLAKRVVVVHLPAKAEPASPRAQPQNLLLHFRGSDPAETGPGEKTLAGGASIAVRQERGAL